MKRRTIKARAALRQAIAASRLAHSEALWTDGYRAARDTWAPANDAEERRLVVKQALQWAACETRAVEVERRLSAVIRAVRAECRDATRRNKQRRGAILRTGSR